MTGLAIAIGTRGSKLALIQANLVLDEFHRSGQASHVVIIETDGDRRAPDTAWGEGAFVAALELALLDGRVDVAVHSAKDVPTEADPRLRIGAYLPRADPRDALVVRVDARERWLDDLPAGTRVGTDSPRRTSFLLARRPDLDVHPLHGNVDTRLRRLDSGETDALVLACAGLDRLGLAGRITQRLDPKVMPPAPGQGAIAVQVRTNDRRVGDLVGAIDDPGTRIAVEAERSFLSTSGGGCRSPIGALATVTASELELFGGYANPDGSGAVRGRRRGPRGAGAQIAGELVRALVPAPQPGIARRVIVARAPEQAAELVLALRDAGLDPVSIPTIAIELDSPGGRLDTVACRLQAYSWVVVTSANGARAMIEAAARVSASLPGPRWAAIGSTTATTLEAAGIAVDFESDPASGAALGEQLPIGPGERVLHVHGDLAGPDLAVALRARGAEVDDVIAYRTLEAPEPSQGLLRAALAEGSIDAVVFTSGSTVRGLVALAQAEQLDIASIPSVCIGIRTAAEARGAGFSVLAVSETPDANVLARTVARSLKTLVYP